MTTPQLFRHITRSHVLAGVMVSAFLVSCTSEETVTPVAVHKPEDKKEEVKPAPVEKAPDVAASLVAPAWSPLTAPKAVALREGSSAILGTVLNGVLVPIASKKTGPAWTVEEVLTLDKLPEGKMGKDAAPEVLVAWWNRLDIQAGDTFSVLGSRGARGTLSVKRELGSADRGGCMGLVIGVPGTLKWTVKPTPAAEGAGDEVLWAVRLPYELPAASPRALNEAEQALAKSTLEQVRGVLKNAQAPLPEGVSWQECDSVSEPTCKSRRTHGLPLDLEGDGKPELLSSVQLRASTGNHIVESRLVLGIPGDKAVVLARWDALSRTGNEDALPGQVVGAVDLTGDGRAELIFSKTLNETENWTVFTSGEKPGVWTELFKTSYEGC